MDCDSSFFWRSLDYMSAVMIAIGLRGMAIRIVSYVAISIGLRVIATLRGIGFES